MTEEQIPLFDTALPEEYELVITEIETPDLPFFVRCNSFLNLLTEPEYLSRRKR